MKRTQLQIEDAAFARLREIAHAKNVSIAHLIREAVDEVYGTGPKRAKVSALTFVGCGRATTPSDGRAASEEHDRELDGAFGE